MLARWHHLFCSLPCFSWSWDQEQHDVGSSEQHDVGKYESAATQVSNYDRLFCRNMQRNWLIAPKIPSKYKCQGSTGLLRGKSIASGWLGNVRKSHRMKPPAASSERSVLFYTLTLGAISLLQLLVPSSWKLHLFAGCRKQFDCMVKVITTCCCETSGYAAVKVNPLVIGFGVFDQCALKPRYD